MLSDAGEKKRVERKERRSHASLFSSCLRKFFFSYFTRQGHIQSELVNFMLDIIQQQTQT